MKLHALVLFSLLTLLTGCIEIIDDLTLNADGSGTFRYNINLSSSKVKINSILALDTLNGKRVPSISEISNRANTIVDLLKTKKGISEVTFAADYDNYIFKLSLDFTNLEALQKAIREVVKYETQTKEIPELDENWLSFDEDKLVRSIPQITVAKTKDIKPEDQQLLKTGSYTSITRFATEVDKWDNEACSLSKNKKAVMIRTDPYSLTQNPNLLDNTIYLVKTD